MNKLPFVQQIATGLDGLTYVCVTAGDEIVPGKVEMSEEWKREGDESGALYIRSENDVLHDVFNGALFE